MLVLEDSLYALIENIKETLGIIGDGHKLTVALNYDDKDNALLRLLVMGERHNMSMGLKIPHRTT